MNNAIEERYVFYRMCRNDFEEALRLLKDSATIEENRAIHIRVSGTLIRYAVVVYFRPFTRSDTRYQHVQHDGKEARKIRLGLQCVPLDLRAFHDELKSYRDSAYAHSDIGAMNPRLQVWKTEPAEFPIATSPVDKKPLHLHRGRIEALCEAGLRWVADEARTIERQLEIDHV